MTSPPKEGEVPEREAGEIRPAPCDRRDPALRITLMPKDTNAAGTIFGGVILSHIDLAAVVEAHKINPHARWVTVAMDRIQFHEPVFVGDLVSFYTSLVRVGTTSVTVKVDVIAARRDDPGKLVEVTEAIVVYVAVDCNRRPVPVRGKGAPGPESEEGLGN